MEINWIRVNRGGLNSLLHDPGRLTLILQWSSGTFEVWGNVTAVQAANLAAAPYPAGFIKSDIAPTGQRLPGTDAGMLALVQTAPPAT